MHAETKSANEHPAGTARIASVLSAAAGLGLFFLTLSGEAMLGASARWLLAYVGAAIAGVLVPRGPSAEQVAWVAALAPLLWSVLGLALPGRGWVWGRRLGARRPSAEEAAAIEDAMALLRGVDPRLREPARVQVLDDPLPEAAARGRTVVLSRVLVESESLAAALAHELGHANTLDGRLTEALNRLALWADPLAPAPARGGGEGGVNAHGDPAAGLLWGLLRWALRLAGGSFAQGLLSPFWAAYWRSREHAADAFAARLGQAEDLARHLADFELALDAPQRRWPFNRSEHPPVAHRIERLRSAAEGAESGHRFVLSPMRGART